MAVLLFPGRSTFAKVVTFDYPTIFLLNRLLVANFSRDLPVVHELQARRMPLNGAIGRGMHSCRLQQLPIAVC